MPQGQTWCFIFTMKIVEIFSLKQMEWMKQKIIINILFCLKNYSSHCNAINNIYFFLLFCCFCFCAKSLSISISTQVKKKCVLFAVTFISILFAPEERFIVKSIFFPLNYCMSFSLQSLRLNDQMKWNYIYFHKMNIYKLSMTDVFQLPSKTTNYAICNRWCYKLSV